MEPIRFYDHKFILFTTVNTACPSHFIAIQNIYTLLQDMSETLQLLLHDYAAFHSYYCTIMLCRFRPNSMQCFPAALSPCLQTLCCRVCLTVTTAQSSCFAAISIVKSDHSAHLTATKLQYYHTFILLLVQLLPYYS